MVALAAAVVVAAVPVAATEGEAVDPGATRRVSIRQVPRSSFSHFLLRYDRPWAVDRIDLSTRWRWTSNGDRVTHRYGLRNLLSWEREAIFR